MDHKTISEKSTIKENNEKRKPKDVVDAFNNFLEEYELFRIDNGLSAKIDNVYEITTSIADKGGRLCRYVKHNERNDPKPDWENIIPEESSGLLVYLIILANRYGLDFSEGMLKELNKAVEQHGK